jgi:serine/threonine protein kinase/tetratricopeptide (TPR) repeat protein
MKPQPLGGAPGPANASSDFLELPAFGRRPGEDAFAVGATVAGRFVIVGSLGRGGMGEVYEARDLELGTSVALKTIRGDIASRPDMVDRFRREVLRARAVAHPNVCRVFDLFAHEDPSGRVVRFLTMELIAGETLSAHLARVGRVPPAEALAMATQVAAAVDAAHALGIVHRDLKPGNVMLTGDGAERRAVVTDFGLAVHVTSLDSLPWTALSETRVGTAGYAAPEQLASGNVDAAADIYSFGVLLHEIVAGCLPDRTGDEPQLSAHLPRRWARAVAACLQHEPDARPRSASAVLEIVAPRRPRAAVALAVVLVAGVALGAGVLRFIDRRAQANAGRDVLLAEIVNATTEADLNGVTELLRRQLEQSRFAHVVPPDQVRRGVRELSKPPNTVVTADLGRELLRRSRAGYLASGTLRSAGNGYVLTLRLETRTDSADERPRSWARSYEARDREELRTSVERGAAWIRSTVGERAEDIPRTNRPAGEVTTSSWKALDLYTQAETLLAGSRQEDALALLEEAVRHDPEFAAAWMRLADVLMSRREHERAYEKWARALEVLDRKKLGLREEYRIRGMFASDTDDQVEAERVYRLYALAYPDDFAPYFYIARPLLMLGRTDEAIQMLERAAEKDPTVFAVPAQLAMFNLRAGRSADVLRHLATLRQMGHADWAECIQAQLDFVEGRYGLALRRFEALETADDPALRTRMPLLQAAALADLGRAADAVERLARSLDHSPSIDPGTRADRLVALASARLTIGDRRGCRDACVLAEQADRSPERIAVIAALLARAGFVADAERLLDRLPAGTMSRRIRIDRERLAGEILLARGRAAEAWRRFQAAAQMEAPGVYPEYLARGAAAAGERGVALAMYERMARDAAYFWRYPDGELPGAWFASLQQTLRLARGTERERALRDLADRARAVATFTMANR